MKRCVCLSLFVAASLWTHAVHAEDDCTKIIATGHPNYPVMAFREGDKIDGAAPALVKAIADELNVPLESKYLGTWAEAVTATREGKADLIVGVYLNDERAQYLEYVEPAFAYDPVVVFVAANRPFGFEGQEDLVGMKGLANKGESFGTEFDTYLENELDVTRADGIDAALEQLVDEKADYVIAGYYSGTAEVEKLGLDDQVVALEPALVNAELFVAFSKKSPCKALAPKFSEGIAEMSTDGRFQEMVDDAQAEWDAIKSPDE